MIKRALVASAVFALAGCVGTPEEESSSSVSSSSQAMVSSTPVQSSSSLAPEPSSSSVASQPSSSSSAAVSSAPPAASECAEVVAEGESLYSSCVGCHGGLVSPGKTAGAAFGAITATDTTWGKDNLNMPLAEYIFKEMGSHIRDCADKEKCAETIAVYLTDNTSAAFCPEPAEQSSSSEAESSSSSAPAQLPEPVWDESLKQGMNEWDSQCKGCHGDDGTAVADPDTGLGKINLAYWLENREALVRKNHNTMPPSSPEGCENECAEQVADYMLANFPRPPVEVVECEGEIEDHLNPPIRSLTTAQYRALVGSVFAPLALNINNAIPDGLMKDTLVAGFKNNSGVVVDQNFEALMEAAEGIAQNAANNFDKLMGCGTNENCVKQFIEQYGEKLFRAAPTNAQVSDLIKVYKTGSAKEGIQYVVTAMLIAPQTIYQFEEAKSRYSALLPSELAARLSFMLWNAAPDKELINELKNIDIANNANAVAQVAFDMLEDERAANGIGQFYKDYLKIEDNFKVVPEAGMAGGALPLGECSTTNQCKQMYDNAVDCSNSQGGICLCGPNKEVCAPAGGAVEGGNGASFPINGKQAANEIKRFTTYLTRENGTYQDLLLSRKAFVDDATAKIYGVTDQANNANTYLGGKEVMLDESQRAGLLTRIGFVIHGGGTKVGLASPTDRGIFTRTKILCQDLPNAPDNVDFPDLPDPKDKTWVEVVKDIHLKPEACADCHRPIDPVGFAFENYTLNGEYIDTYPNGKPVDASGWFDTIQGFPLGNDIDERTFVNAIEVSEMIAGNPVAAACFSSFWVSYALTRDATSNNQDACAVDQVSADFKQGGYSLKELIGSIVRSPAFRFRNPETNAN